MNKFSNIQASEPYVNFTVHNYIDCYRDLNAESIEHFTNLFKNLKSHKISIGNYLVEQKPIQGVKLVESKKDNSSFREDPLLSTTITNLSKLINPEDKKEILFYKSLVHFCDSINFLNATELKEVNDLFEEVHSYQCNLNNPIVEEQLLFYSYNRYPSK